MRFQHSFAVVLFIEMYLTEIEIRPTPWKFLRIRVVGLSWLAMFVSKFIKYTNPWHTVHMIIITANISSFVNLEYWSVPKYCKYYCAIVIQTIQFLLKHQKKKLYMHYWHVKPGSIFNTCTCMDTAEIYTSVSLIVWFLRRNYVRLTSRHSPFLLDKLQCKIGIECVPFDVFKGYLGYY